MNATSVTETRSRLTSYHALFTRSVPGVPAVQHVEIPLIQRDYAQGREGASVERIRAGFLDVLYGALTSENPICLDFVYGDVEDGTLRPLDGQQRLTTLFLLHWYLASRAGFLEQEQPAKEHLDFLFRAFDMWIGRDIAAEFRQWFAAAPESGETSKVVLFEQSDSNLFADCCATYGAMRNATTREFGWNSILLLYAVVLHHIHKTDNFPRRLRTLRNLLEASSNELRLGNMPKLVGDVHRVVVEGTLDGVEGFNQAQVDDERKKAALLEQAPLLERALFQLEDHGLLRGRLFAFELEAEVFARRAEAFHRVFAAGDMLSVTGALLATGDYSRERNSRFQFGARNDAPWRRLLAEGSRPAIARTREVLAQFLDEFAHRGLPDALDAITNAWLSKCEQERTFDWRYYFVKYPAMREGDSGIYAGNNGRLDYDVCMLDRRQMNSNYRDPYLFAIHRESGVGDAVKEPWFTGPEWQPRRMLFIKSATGVRSVAKGIFVGSPSNAAFAESFANVCAAHRVESDGLLNVPQSESSGYLVDAQDRIQLGAQLLRDLVDAGL